MLKVRVPTKTRRIWSPIVIPSMTGRYCSRPYIRMALWSVGEKRWRFAMAARTCPMASGSRAGATAENKKTSTYRVSQMSPAVEKGMKADSSSLA